MKKTIENISKQANGTNIDINMEKIDEIFGECTSFARNIRSFTQKVESEEHSHQIDKGILDYFVEKIFQIDDKIKEQFIKKIYKKHSLAGLESILPRFLKAQILVETIVETDDDGEVTESEIKVVEDPNTLDDVNDLADGVGDNAPTCGPKVEDKQFEDCDLEYGLEVFCYNSSKLPWADWRLQFPLFRGLYSIFDNADDIKVPPLACGYLVENDYPQADCHKALYFPTGEKEDEERDTLRDADLFYEFFIEEQEGCFEDDDIPCYIFQMGYGGTADIFPVIKDVIKTDEERINNAVKIDNRDFNGLFSEDDIAFIYKNKPKEYNAAGYAQLMVDETFNFNPSKAREGTPSSSGFSAAPPAVATHGSYSFIMTEENIIINEQLFLNEGNVEAETETGATEEAGGVPQNIIVDLGRMFPMRVIAVTKEELDITVEDILNDELPDIPNNLYKGVVKEKDTVNLRGDEDATIAGERLGYSKYIEGYDVIDHFSEDKVNEDILKKIIGPQEDFGNRKIDDPDNFYIDEDIKPDAYKYNGLNINKIKIDSDAVLQPNATEGGFEEIVNPSIYITAVVSTKNYYRQIVQVHSKLKNDRPIHTPEEVAVIPINPNSPAQLPMPDGEYEDPVHEIISESFIFGLFCHDVDDRTFYEWRMTELANDAWLIWKRWLLTTLDKPGIFIPEDSDISQNETTSKFLGTGDPYGYGEAEPMFYTGDKEGIKVILVDIDGNFSSKVLLERDKIWDQEWFDHFLQVNGREGKKIEDDLEFSSSLINDTRKNTRGLLFDVSYYVNNNLPDAVKIPYERCFAAAIMQCSKAVIPEEQAGDEDAPQPTVGIGIQPLDFINNPSINEDAVEDIVEEDNAILWCENDEGGAFVDGPEPKDKLLLKESLEILLALYEDANGIDEEDDYEDEIAAVQAYLDNIINQEKRQRPNDLSYSVFVSKVADFETKDITSGYQKRALTRRFSEADKNDEAKGYLTLFRDKEAYLDLFGPDDDLQSTVVIPASGETVYAYAKDNDDLGLADDEEPENPEDRKQDLPPGNYKIVYKSGGYLYGCGDGRSASIHDPDTECDGVYVRFNSPAPCAENQFLAPGTRDEYDNIGDLEEDFFGKEEGERIIKHLGGPISFQLVLKERAREECPDGSGDGTVQCDEGQCLTYCVFPVFPEGADDDDFPEITPVITDQYDDFSTTTTKNYVELPTMYEPEGMSENARMYVETFSIPRMDELGNQDDDYLHPQFNCLGIYPDHPIEYMNLIDVGDINFLGDISVASFAKRHDAILVTPEYNTGSMSYHIVNFEKHGAWTEFGISQEDIKEFVNLTSRITDTGLEIEDFTPQEVEDKVRSRADQIQKWAHGFYNRGKIINTVDGAICVGKICARAVEGPEYNLLDYDDAYFFTDGEELRDSINGIKDKDIRGWVKNIVVEVDPVTVYSVDHIGFTPFGKKSKDIVSGSDILFLGRSNVEIPTSVTRYDDGVQLLSNIKFENADVEPFYQRLDTSYGRIYDGGEFFASEEFDADDIIEVQYLKDDIFEKYKVNNTRNCTVTDNKNRVFIFYELKGNIACAMGHNLNTENEQWFNFEGIVRTLANEKATQPYVVSSDNGRTFYLFFKLNNQFICQKTLTAANFVIKDAFKEYWPISDFDADTPEDFGLTQFEYEGRDIRKGVINVIAGGSPEKCLSSTVIEEEEATREEAGLTPRIRLAFNCIRNEKIALEEFAAYKDRKGHLILFFTTDRQFMNIMSSNNEGRNWQDIQRYMHMTHLPFLQSEKYDFECETGLANDACIPSTYLKEEDASITCDTRVLERMEIVFDSIKNIIYLIYTFDEGLYVRQFDAGNIERVREVLPNSSAESISNVIKNHFNLNVNSDNKPVQITGKVSEDKLEEQLYVQLESATSAEVEDKGNGVFQIARPGAHVTKDGILKIYYFDKDLVLWSVSLMPGTLKAIPTGEAAAGDDGDDGGDADGGDAAELGG